MSHPILVGVDLDHAPLHALREALYLGGELGLPVTVVTVVGAGDEESPLQAAKRTDAMKVRLEELAGLVQPDPPVDIRTRVAIGHPVQALLQAVEDEGAGLLVLGSHAGGPSLLGTTAERLLRSCPCPVLIRRDARRHGAPVVVALDEDAASIHAARQGAHLARELGVELVILHVHYAPAWLLGPKGEPREIEVLRKRDAAYDAIRRIVAGLELGDARLVLETGDPRKRIARFASETGADLVVMGTHGHRGLARWALGSTTEYVVRHSAGSVLAVLPEDPDFLIG